MEIPFLFKHFSQKEGVLQVAGKPITALAKTYGTPLYIFDSSVLAARQAELKKYLPRNLEVTYAVKANPHVEIIRALGKLYTGLDLASAGEMEKALQAGVAAKKMSFAGPSKTEAEIRFAISHDIGTLSVESEREVDFAEAIAKELGKKANILIRVNPAFELSRSGLKMGGGSKAFGIDSERVPDLIQRLQSSVYLEWKGIHIFAGTQNLNADSILEAMGKILEYAHELQETLKLPIQILNLGGGFGIPYFKGDNELDLAAVGLGLQKLMDQYVPLLPHTHLKIELGRYLVGECGLYITRILYKKISRGQIFLMVDGGMHHHLAASGNISQSPIRRQMLLTVANKLNAPLEKVNVAGSLCTPLDTFGQQIELPQAEEGDLLIIPNSGAYGLSMSPSSFLSHTLPQEVLL